MHGVLLGCALPEQAATAARRSPPPENDPLSPGAAGDLPGWVEQPGEEQFAPGGGQGKETNPSVRPMLCLFALWAVLGCTATFPMDLDYTPAGAQIEITNSGRHFNRPLYGASNGLVVLGGDRPIVKFAAGTTNYGTLMVALRRGGDNSTMWAQLDPAMNTVASFRPGISSWIVSTPKLPGVTLNMTAAPTDGGVGMAVGIAVQGPIEAGDQLLWVFGGISGGFDSAKLDPSINSTRLPPSTHSSADNRGNIALQAQGFDPVAAKGDHAAVLNTSHFLLADSDPDIKQGQVRGVTSSLAPVVLAGLDTSTQEWQNASALLAGQGQGALTADGVLVGGTIDLSSEPRLFLSFNADPSTARLAETAEQTWGAAMQRTLAMEHRVQVQCDTCAMCDVRCDEHVTRAMPSAGADT